MIVYQEHKREVVLETVDLVRFVCKACRSKPLFYCSIEVLTAKKGGQVGIDALI
jgi:hypothetical protein